MHDEEFSELRRQLNQQLDAGCDWSVAWCLFVSDPVVQGLLARTVQRLYDDGSLDASVGRADVEQNLRIALGREIQKHFTDLREVNLEQWIRGVIKHRCLDDIRKLDRQRKRRIQDATEYRKMAERQAERAKIRRLVETAENLTDLQRHVARLWICGYTNDEIAAAVGISKTNVSNVKAEVSERLKAYLGDDD